MTGRVKPGGAPAATRLPGLASALALSMAAMAISVPAFPSPAAAGEVNAQGAALPFPPGSPFYKFFGNPDQNPQKHRFGTALGSGFFISADGYAVTNNHVVEHGRNFEITTDDGKTYPAKVIGTDSKTD